VTAVGQLIGTHYPARIAMNNPIVQCCCSRWATSCQQDVNWRTLWGTMRYLSIHTTKHALIAISLLSLGIGRL